VEDDDRRLNGVFTKPSPSPLAGVQTLFQRDEHIGRSPLPLHQANQTGRDGFLVHKTSIRDEDVESLGADITLKTSATTDKILARTGVSGFDELGAILVVVQSKADELDPSSIAKKGIAGWIQRRFGNLKAELTLRLKNADQVFQKLEGKIADHAAVQSEWIKDLETSYAENLERYSRIRSTIEKGRLWEAAMLSELESWPAIDPQDPDALMKGQARRDAEARLNRLRIKLDGFLRLQAVTENRAPRIRSQQETAPTTWPAPACNFNRHSHKGEPMSDSKTKVLGVQFTDAAGKQKTLHFPAPTGKHAGKEAITINPKASSATALEFCPGVFMTHTL
jgi:hypothetical protein